MQTKIVLNPAYKGPIIIEEYLRKMKSQSSLGRMLSNFNKRFFVLDFRHMKFYYLPEKGSQLSTATDIQLEAITRVYIDNQLQMLDDDQIWKHGFVILCGKRSYRLISYSRNNMENLLYGLAHLINTETGKPLFDWNEYRASQEQDPGRGSEVIRPQIFSPAMLEKEKEKAAVAQKVSRSSSDEAKGDLRAPQNPESHKQVKASNKERQEALESPERPERNVRQENNIRQENQVREHARVEEIRRESNERVMKSREGSNDPEKRQERNVPKQNVNQVQRLKSELDSVGLSESRVVTGNESVHVANQDRDAQYNRHDAQESREEGRKLGSIRAKVEVLTIEPSENTVEVNKNQGQNSAGMNPAPGKVNNGWEPKLVSPKGSFGGRPLARNASKKSSDEEVSSGGLNEVEIAPRKKKSSNDSWDAPDKSRNRMQQNEQDQNDGWGIPKKDINARPAKVVEEDDGGWGRVEAPPKKAEVYSAKKNVVNDDDDWDRDMQSPPKKSAKKVEVKENSWASEAAVKKGMPSHVQSNAAKKAQNNDDDDWDREMFGDDDDYKAPTKKAEVKTDYRSSNLNSGYSSGFGNYGKSTIEKSSYKQVEVPVAKTKAHNDWDDDL